MATRPIYVPNKNKPCVNVFMPEFEWNGGFAVSQKQKNIKALHNAFNRRFPDLKVLEISSKSLEPIGVQLSAFNLKKYVPELNESVPVECVFQGGKVFAEGGPFTELYKVTPKEAKRDSRLRSSGALTHFFFDGKEIPLIPRTAFYNWLYINALLENPDLSGKVLGFDAFSDIEFNPNKSINCQAEAAATFVALAQQGLLEQCRSFEAYIRLLH